MKVKYVQKPDVGTDYYIDSNGRFVASFTRDTPPEGVAEVLGNIDYRKVTTDTEPPAGGPWRWDDVAGGWVEIPRSAVEKRRAEYQQKISTNDAIDAIYKGLNLLIPDLVKAGVLSPETAAALTPDKNARPDEPAGMLGIISDIKARNPKT